MRDYKNNRVKHPNLLLEVIKAWLCLCGMFVVIFTLAFMPQIIELIK